MVILICWNCPWWYLSMYDWALVGWSNVIHIHSNQRPATGEVCWLRKINGDCQTGLSCNQVGKSIQHTVPVMVWSMRPTCPSSCPEKQLAVTFLVLWFVGELHLTPLHGVLQLRPSFDYLNKGQANSKQGAAHVNEDGQYILVTWYGSSLCIKMYNEAERGTLNPNLNKEIVQCYADSLTWTSIQESEEIYLSICFL